MRSLQNLALVAGCLALVNFAAQAQFAAPELQQRLATLERLIESKRLELGVQGASLVVVMDGRVVLLKGFGVKDAVKKLPVTPDTVFQIGSATKAFTGLAMMLSVEEKKLALSDPPRKFVPYFKLQDADADQRITLLDLLTHRSGLQRTDLAWYSGQFTREEVIRIAGQAKPQAKLGEAFLYQNVMFSVAIPGAD